MLREYNEKVDSTKKKQDGEYRQENGKSKKE